MNKSRQIGFSTIIAGEGIAVGLVASAYKANYISINQTEAADKIEIARNFYHSIPDAFASGDDPIKPVLWTDSEHEISFGRPPKVSTLISQPASSAIRGGRKDIYFDEFAHIRDATKLYQAALPAITRGDSRLTIVSTPLGQSGLFYDICVNRDAFPEYTLHMVPWWECSAMVREGTTLDAYNLAAAMGTAERVKAFGSDKLQAILSSFGGDVMGFQTEYECMFVDETEAFFPFDLILRGVDDSISSKLPAGWEAKGNVTIGVDLAKERDQSVFTVVEHIVLEDGEKRSYVRMLRATQDTYEKQLTYLLELIKRFHPSRVSIDQTGVGQMFVERAKAAALGGVVEGVVFTNGKKESWATRFKAALQGEPAVRYPRSQDLISQIHGVRRTKTEANFYKFSGRHDDYFWSLMLALYGEGRVPVRITSLG